MRSLSESEVERIESIYGAIVLGISMGMLAGLGCLLDFVFMHWEILT